MTKSEIVASLSSELNMPKAQVRRLVDALVEQIAGALAKGTKVQLAGLGVFDVKQRAARQGRNPQSGETITIAARKAVRYRAAKSLKDAVK